MPMISEKVLDRGARMERTNKHCETGFPDVHMNFIMEELGGSLASETGPWSCDLDNGGTRQRMVDYKYDFFTTEDYLIDALSLIGPTTINLLVTPQMQHYKGGWFYTQECSDYAFETIPEVCKVYRDRGVRERDVLVSYTCLNVSNVNTKLSNNDT